MTITTVDRRRSSRPRSRGQALVEFALIAPFFFLLLFGIIEAGRFMFYYETLSNATREGARYAIVNGANSIICSTGPAAPDTTSCDPGGKDVQDWVRSSAFGMIGSAIQFPTNSSCINGETDGPCWNPNNGRGSTVTVTATYTYSTLIPLVPLPAITVEAESSLVVNN